MRYPQHSETTDIEGGKSLFQHPRIALLNEKHWSYIQRHYNMSPRELQVAELVCQGFNNDEIAKALKIKHGTVKTHLRNIYRRIRVKNKITMLLKFVDSATKFSAKSEITPPVPIAGIEKPAQKIFGLAQIRKKER